MPIASIRLIKTEPFETSRSLVGPESQMAFDVYGTKGALSWNLERLNELRLHLTPGKYLLFCNIPGHFANGMWTEVTVQ